MIHLIFKYWFSSHSSVHDMVNCPRYQSLNFLSIFLPPFCFSIFNNSIIYDYPKIKICQSSQIFISICFPRAFAYFSSTTSVGTLPPLSNRAIFDGFIPVISAISCCVIFWRCLSSTNCRIVSEDLLNTFSWIFSVYTSSLFSLVSFSVRYSFMFSCICLSPYPISDILFTRFYHHDKFLQDILCFFYRTFSSVLFSLSVFHGV